LLVYLKGKLISSLVSQVTLKIIPRIDYSMMRGDMRSLTVSILTVVVVVAVVVVVIVVVQPNILSN